MSANTTQGLLSDVRDRAFNDDNTHEPWVHGLIAINGILGGALLICNVFILVTSKFTSGGKNPTLIFIRSLCVADALVGVAPVIKGFEMEYAESPLALTNCFMGESVIYTAILASALLILGFSADTYLRMVSPVKYINNVDKSLVITIMILIWNFAFILGFIPQMGWNMDHYTCHLFEYYANSYILTACILMTMILIAAVALHIDFYHAIQRTSNWVQNRRMYVDNMRFMTATRIEVILLTVVCGAWFTFVFLHSPLGVLYMQPKAEEYIVVLFTVLIVKSHITTLMHFFTTKQIYKVAKKAVHHFFSNKCGKRRKVSRNDDKNATTRSGISVISLDSPETSRARALSVATVGTACSLDSFKNLAVRTPSIETMTTMTSSPRKSQTSSPPKLKRTNSLTNIKLDCRKVLHVSWSDSVTRRGQDLKAEVERKRSQSFCVQSEINIDRHLSNRVPKIVLQEIVAVDVHHEDQAPQSSTLLSDKRSDCSELKNEAHSSKQHMVNSKMPLRRAIPGYWTTSEPMKRMDSLKVPSHLKNFHRSRTIKLSSLEDLKTFGRNFDRKMSHYLWKSDATTLPNCDSATSTVAATSDYLSSLPDIRIIERDTKCDQSDVTSKRSEFRDSGSESMSIDGDSEIGTVSKMSGHKKDLCYQNKGYIEDIDETTAYNFDRRTGSESSSGKSSVIYEPHVHVGHASCNSTEEMFTDADDLKGNLFISSRYDEVSLSRDTNTPGINNSLENYQTDCSQKSKHYYDRSAIPVQDSKAIVRLNASGAKDRELSDNIFDFKEAATNDNEDCLQQRENNCTSNILESTKL